MALLRGKLFAGALFAGLLLGQACEVVTPPVVVQDSGGIYKQSKKYKPPVHAYRTDIAELQRKAALVEAERRLTLQLEAKSNARKKHLRELALEARALQAELSYIQVGELTSEVSIADIVALKATIDAEKATAKEQAKTLVEQANTVTDTADSIVAPTGNSIVEQHATFSVQEPRIESVAHTEQSKVYDTLPQVSEDKVSVSILSTNAESHTLFANSIQPAANADVIESEILGKVASLSIQETAETVAVTSEVSIQGSADLQDMLAEADEDEAVALLLILSMMDA